MIIMKRMERIFSVPLKGGAVTDVYSADSLAELHESLRAMGSSMLFIADDNTERFLPERAERIILPHGHIGEGESPYARTKGLGKRLLRGKARGKVLRRCGYRKLLRGEYPLQEAPLLPLEASASAYIHADDPYHRPFSSKSILTLDGRAETVRPSEAKISPS